MVQLRRSYPARMVARWAWWRRLACWAHYCWAWPHRRQGQRRTASGIPGQQHRSPVPGLIRQRFCQGFSKLGLDRMWGVPSPLNEASARRRRRPGWFGEGCIHCHLFTFGSWRDSIVRSALVDECVVAAEGSAKR